MIYGDMLSYFNELMKKYPVFKMRPEAVSGYRERYDQREVEGYWSWRKLSKLGEQGDLRALNYAATFWVKRNLFTKDSPVRQNDCVEVDGEVFRAMDDQDFSREGSFIRVLMERFVGITDQQVANTRVDRVIKDDY